LTVILTREATVSANTAKPMDGQRVLIAGCGFIAGRHADP